MNRLPRPSPWPLSFSYARALQAPALWAWRGEPARVPEGQRALLHRARCNSAARAEQYTAALEGAGTAP
jgi:fructose-bisphosphate aldolase class I